MQKATGVRGTSPSPGKDRGAMWLLVGAALLCPVSKLIILASMGGALGGMLGDQWFAAGVFAVVAVGAWLGIRLVRNRLARRHQSSLLQCGDLADLADDARPDSAPREVRGVADRARSDANPR